MNKKLFNKISFFSLILFAHVLFAGLDHQGLFDIMRPYKKIDKDHHHWGDLFEHSTWVSKAIEKWFVKKDEWCEGLENHKRVLIVAGFLHDIGKAGDLEFVFERKPNHPRDGFDYMRGTKEFKVPNSDSPFNFDEYFKQLSVTEEERKIIEILAANHWDLAGYVMIPWETCPEEQRTVSFEEDLFERFLKCLKLLLVSTTAGLLSM